MLGPFASLLGKPKYAMPAELGIPPSSSFDSLPYLRCPLVYAREGGSSLVLK